MIVLTALKGPHAKKGNLCLSEVLQRSGAELSRPLRREGVRVRGEVRRGRVAGPLPSVAEVFLRLPC